MRRRSFQVVASTVLLLGVAFVKTAASKSEEPKIRKGMKITSSAFRDGGDIPAKYSRGEGNINPPLHIEETPNEAKSLVLIMDDPDAPVGLFTHWLVWNIDPKTTDVLEHSTPKGAVEGTNDYPNQGYGGPQPPSGVHRYYFKFFALDQTLDLRAGARRNEVENAIKGHVIAQGQLMGRYAHRK